MTERSTPKNVAFDGPRAEAERVRAESGAYRERLGIEVVDAQVGWSRLRLPTDDRNTNRGGGVHGGVIVSLALAGGELSAESTVRADDVGPRGRVLSTSMMFIRPVRGEDLFCESRILRRGRDLAYVESRLVTGADEEAARGHVVYRFGPGTDAPNRDVGAVLTAPVALCAGTPMSDVTDVELGSPYMRDGGVRVVDTGASEWAGLRMPAALNFGPDGFVDDGALVGLADTVGAFACYKQGGFNFKKRTASFTLAMTFRGSTSGDVFAAGRVTAAGNADVASLVEVVDAGGIVLAAAAIDYRVMTVG